MLKTTISLAGALLGLGILPLPVPAATYSFSTTGDLPGSTGAGQTTSIETSYNTSTDLFKWSSTFTPNSHGILPDGAWLVVNDGPNPKGNAGELAIAYLDEQNETVSLFEYNGLNKADSYLTPGNLLATTKLNTQRANDSVTFGFDFNATDLNNLSLGDDWKGLQFNDSIGIWFHGVSELETKYADEQLSLFVYNYQSWYDTANKKTEKIPEPSILLGLLGLGAYAVTQKLRG